MGHMYLHQEVADLRGELGRDILNCHPAEKDRGSLASMGQVIESGGKIGIADEAASCCAGEIRHRNCGMATVRPIHESKGDRMTQTRWKEGALGAVITRIFVPQDRGRKTRDACSAGTGEAVSVEATVGSRAGVPLMGVLVGHICHTEPCIEGGRDETSRTKIGLNDVFEFASKVH